MHTSKPFVVSDDYIDWAHGSAAEEEQPLAVRLFEQPIKGNSRLIVDPQLVAEIANVAELYVGGDDNILRAANVRARAVKWLNVRGMTVRSALTGR